MKKLCVNHQLLTALNAMCDEYDKHWKEIVVPKLAKSELLLKEIRAYNDAHEVLK
jgi:hypothetical protein